jgi:hypothetical protein
MFLALLQAAPVPSVEQDALQAILDGAAQGNIILAVVGGVVLIGIVLLGIFKKDHPLIKPLADVILKLGRAFSKPKAIPADQPGLAAVTPIKKLDQSESSQSPGSDQK